MSAPHAKPAQQQRKVALDRPCTACGQPIYYRYKGPIDGLCGRCTDRRLARHRGRARSRTVVVERSGRGGAGWLPLLVAFFAGAAAMYLVHPFLPF